MPIEFLSSIWKNGSILRFHLHGDVIELQKWVYYGTKWVKFQKWWICIFIHFNTLIELLISYDSYDMSLMIELISQSLKLKWIKIYPSYVQNKRLTIWTGLVWAGWIGKIGTLTSRIKIKLWHFFMFLFHFISIRFCLIKKKFALAFCHSTKFYRWKNFRWGWNFDFAYRLLSLLTIATHANSNAFLMATILASISTSLINDTVTPFSTSIIDFVDLWSAKESLNLFERLQSVCLCQIRSSQVNLGSFTLHPSQVIRP